MDEGFFICAGILALLCLFASLPIAIAALVIALRARREARDLAPRLRDQARAGPTAEAPAPPVRAAPVSPVPGPERPAADAEAAAPPAPPRPVAAAPLPPKPPRKPIQWEEWIGLKGLAVAGIVVFLIGAVLFATYAHEQGWFGRRGYFQVGLLVLGGLAFLAAGEWYERKTFQVLSRVLTGGGLALEYFALVAAWARFHIIPEPAAWTLMIVITGVAILLSVRYASLAVAILSLVGGLAGPLAIRPDRDPGHILFLYLVVVNLGVLAVAYFRKWRVLNLLALGGTIVNVCAWLYTHYYHGAAATEKLAFIVTYMTVLWAIYFAVSLVYHLVGRRNPSRLDLPVTIINVVAYYTGLYVLLRTDHHHWLGGIAAVLGAVYLVEGLAIRKWAPVQARFVLLQLAQALGLVTLAIPIQLKGIWIPMAWGAEAAVLFWLGVRLKDWRVRSAALLVHLASVIALGYFAEEAWDTKGMLLVNARTATFAVVALAMALSAWFYRRAEGKTAVERVVVTIAAGLAHLVLMILIGVEVCRWHADAAAALRKRSPADLWQQLGDLSWVRDAVIATGLAVYGLVAVGLVAILRRGFHHAMALVAFAACFVVLLIAQEDVPALEFVAGWNAVGATFAGVAVCLALAAVVSRYFTRPFLGARGMAIAYELLALGVVLGLYLTELFRADAYMDDELPVYLSHTSLYSLVAAGVAVMAGVVMLRGFWIQSLAHRVVGLAATAVAIILLFAAAFEDDCAYDTVLWQPRGVAFLLLIAAMALAVVGYLRHPAQVAPERGTVGPVVAVLVHLVVLGCFTLEAQDFWNAHAEAWFPRQELHAWYARHATLSVGYALYALALLGAGIRRRSKLLRVLALAILGGTIAKVMLLDLSQLEAIWRILSFVGLGMLLLVASLLYYKFRHVIFPAETGEAGTDEKETSDETA